MACSACGQKYNQTNRTRLTDGNQAENIPYPLAPPRTYNVDHLRPPYTPTQAEIDMIKPPARATQKQASNTVPDPTGPVDHATGIPLSIIKDGADPETQLGDTSSQPTKFEIITPGESKQ